MLLILKFLYLFFRFSSALATAGSGSRPFHFRLKLVLETNRRDLKFVDPLHQRGLHSASIGCGDRFVGVDDGFSNVGVALIVVVDGVVSHDVEIVDRRPDLET
jgi:hypothetical protein